VASFDQNTSRTRRTEIQNESHGSVKVVVEGSPSNLSARTEKGPRRRMRARRRRSREPASPRGEKCICFGEPGSRGGVPKRGEADLLLDLLKRSESARRLEPRRLSNGRVTAVKNDISSAATGEKLAKEADREDHRAGPSAGRSSHLEEKRRVS